jgi:hypothetical protein
MGSSGKDGKTGRMGRTIGHNWSLDEEMCSKLIFASTFPSFPSFPSFPPCQAPIDFSTTRP